MEYYGTLWHCASQICFWRAFEEWQNGILFSWLCDPSKQEFCRVRDILTSPLSSGAEATSIQLGVCRWLDCTGLDAMWMALHIFNVAWVLTDSVPCSSMADSSVTLGKVLFPYDFFLLPIICWACLHYKTFKGEGCLFLLNTSESQGGGKVFSLEITS